MANSNTLKHLAKHPYNPEVVKKVKKAIIEHVEACYPPGKKPRPKDWYFGIAEKPDTDRQSDHRSEKELAELKHHTKEYAYSLSNARQVELELCQEFGLEGCNRIGRPSEKTKWVYGFDRANSPTKSDSFSK